MKLRKRSNHNSSNVQSLLLDCSSKCLVCLDLFTDFLFSISRSPGLRGLLGLRHAAFLFHDGKRIVRGAKRTSA